MTGFFRRRNDGLEDRLRGLGSEPRSDLVSGLSGEIRASRIPARMRTRRFAAALVTTAMMLIPFAAFGGVGLAASAAPSKNSWLAGGSFQPPRVSEFVMTARVRSAGTSRRTPR